ncbi:hypothetical protein LSH36_271g02017 [Paralvinella palmiformis]|uniref:non-specific serine/threonine protein kinase n=1 Tax=Paralvinella palmiformis TaxID=53620 RepID=A0AAD9N2H6_9ANNE|nr:hypothetical protein LSH36_271g02017 [Paralvinella palmiformis]
MATAMQRRAAHSSKSRGTYQPTEMPSIDQRTNIRVPTYTFGSNLRPIAHLGYEGARHLIPERLPSSTRGRTVGFRVIDLNHSIVDSIRSVASSLRRLDLSDLRLDFVDPEMIDGLLRLERIVLDHNRIDENGFPDNIARLDHLVELSAHDNCLTQLPTIIRKLRSLQRLKLSENRLKSLEGIDKLKRLQILVLDENRLQVLSKEFFSHLKRLEYLHCSRNALTAVPSDVRNLRLLKDLNVSHNRLTSLPAEVFVLPNIEVINASDNQIDRLPTITVKGSLKRKLTTIDLSNNLLIRFPAHLMFMTGRLDLCSNRIRTIPLGLIDKLDQVPELQLMLDENPMSLPPQDVCASGLRSIVQYFMEIKTVMRIHQGVRVLVLGPTGQGKTSLIQTMTDQQARTTDGERTLGVDLYEHNISLEKSDDPLTKRLHLSLWDFSGETRYLFQHQYFLQPNSLVLLVFNMAEYSAAKFRSCFGIWIDWMLFRMNRIVAVPVGTHADRLKPAKAKQIGDDVMKQIRKYVADIRSSIEREIKRIDSKAYISAALSEQLEMYRNLLRMEVLTAESVVTVSSKENSGIEQLEEAILKMVDNKDAFPNVLREIPSLWGEVVNFIDDKGYAMQVPMMRWDEYVALVTGKFGMRHLIQAITEFMHDTGKIIWYSDHPTLRDYVFLRPSWLVDVFKAIFRHDIDQLDYSLEESFRQHNISQPKFEKMINEVVDEATFDRELIKCLWSSVIQSDFNRPVLELLAVLLEHFEIGYATVIRPSRNTSAISSVSKGNITTERSGQDCLDFLPNAQSPASRKGSITPRVGEKYEPGSATSRSKQGEKSSAEIRTNPPRISKILIPWLLNTEQPAKFREEYQSFSGHASAASVFRFPKYIPPGMFEKFTIRALKDEHDLTKLYHWKNGLYARHIQNGVRLYLQRIEHDDGSTCISVECRHESRLTDEDTEKQVEQIWQVLLPFLKDCEDVIAKCTGARMERYMECPYCRGLSFLGEWLTPKELQAVDVKMCDNCNRDVSTSFLVQPKEKKRVEEFLLKRLLEEAEKRRLAFDEATTNNDPFSPVCENGDNNSDDIHPNVMTPMTSDSRNKANQKGVEKQRGTNGDRARSGTTSKGTVRINVPGAEKSPGSRLRTHSNRTTDSSIQEEHILVTLTEQTNE